MKLTPCSILTSIALAGLPLVSASLAGSHSHENNSIDERILNPDVGRIGHGVQSSNPYGSITRAVTDNKSSIRYRSTRRAFAADDMMSMTMSISLSMDSIGFDIAHDVMTSMSMSMGPDATHDDTESGLFDLANDNKAESGSNEPVNATNEKETSAVDPTVNDTEEVKMTDDSPEQIIENNTEVVVRSSEESGDDTASHGKGSPVDVGISVAVIVITVLLFLGIIWKRRSG